MRGAGVLLLALFVSAEARAQDVLTLVEARRMALEGRHQIEAGRLRVAAAVSEADAAGAGQRPRVGALIEVGASPGGQLNDVIDVEGDRVTVAAARPLEDGLGAFEPVLRYGAGVSLNWTVLDFGRTAAAERAAEAESLARTAELAQTRSALLEAVDGAYLVWLGAEERLELEGRALTRAEKRLERITERLAAGTEAESALLPARYALVAVELRKSNARHAAQLARLGLGAAVGKDIPPKARPDRGLLTLNEGASGPRAALLQIEALTARVRAARAKATATDRAMDPSFVISGQAGLRGQLGSLFPMYQAGLSLQIPLIDGGAGHARAEAALAEAKALAEREAAAREELEREDRRRAAWLTNARERVELSEQLLGLAEKAREDVELRAEESAAGPDELASADERVAGAQEILLEARLERARILLNEESAAQ